jgi:hypothetical protein
VFEVQSDVKLKETLKFKNLDVHTPALFEKKRPRNNALLLHIQAVMSSNLSPETSYPVCFSLF